MVQSTVSVQLPTSIRLGLSKNTKKNQLSYNKDFFANLKACDNSNKNQLSGGLLFCIYCKLIQSFGDSWKVVISYCQTKSWLTFQFRQLKYRLRHLNRYYAYIVFLISVPPFIWILPPPSMFILLFYYIYPAITFNHNSKLYWNRPKLPTINPEVTYSWTIGTIRTMICG